VGTNSKARKNERPRSTMPQPPKNTIDLSAQDHDTDGSRPCLLVRGRDAWRRVEAMLVAQQNRRHTAPGDGCLEQGLRGMVAQGHPEGV